MFSIEGALTIIDFERRESMGSKSFMRVDDVARELSISKSYAYKIVQRLNSELRELGYLTISGRISKEYFMKKVCYSEQKSRK
jgi:DNA-binding IclR family transcriptional regulator